MSLGFKKFLSGNRGASRPRHVLFYDVESHVSDPVDGKQFFTPFLWTAILATYRKDNDNWYPVYHHGTTVDDFWSIIDQFKFNKQKLYMVSHHMEADFIPLDGINQLLKRGWVLDKPIQNGRTVLYYWSHGTDKLVVMNNGNLFDGSIAAWGKLLGLSKLEMPAADAPLSDWITYCMRDTEIMYQMWRYLYQFMADHDLGNFKLTKASLAFSAYRHRFMHRKIVLHQHAQATVLERDSYRGGRFEALQFGDFSNDTYYKLDYNSMYASIMINQSLPYQLCGYLDYPSLTVLESKLQNYQVIAEVELNPNQPVFPRTIDHKTRWLPGRLTTCLTDPELRYALQNSWIKRVLRMAWYYHDFILKDFAEYFSELKIRYTKEDNPGMRALAKIFPNAVYGKFAQKQYDYVELGEAPPGVVRVLDDYVVETGERRQIYIFNGKTHLATTGIAATNAFIAIASIITGHARTILWYTMLQAGLENVYHVATDSLIVNQAGYERLQNRIDPDKIGFLKLEGVTKSLIIRGINDLVFDGVEKIKGVNKNAPKIDANTYRITQWPSIKAIIKTGELSQYFVRLVDKTLERPNYKTY